MSRAALYDTLGGPDVLYIAEVDDVPPGPGRIAVRVAAAGLNPFDGKQRSGFIPSDEPFPRRIGGDVAGTVEAVGEGAAYADGKAISVGDEVMGRAVGAVGERVLASASEIARRPPALPVEQAGSLWVAGLTALSCVVTVPLGQGDTVLVGGAAGGVGFVAAQLAVARGARVIGTASERNHELLRSVGVEPVMYGAGLEERVGALGTLTAVIDTHGREALDAGLALGVSADRMVAIAAYAAVDELGVHNAERAARTAENLALLAEEIVAGRLIFPVAASYPLGEVVAAFAAMESSHAPGKIVVEP